MTGLDESATRVRRRHRNSEKPGGAPIFLGLVLGVLLVAIPSFYFLGWKAENPEEVPEKMAENAKKTIESIKNASKKKPQPPEPEPAPAKPKEQPIPENPIVKKPAETSPPPSGKKPESIAQAPVVAKPPVGVPPSTSQPIRANPVREKGKAKPKSKPTVAQTTPARPKPDVTPKSKPKATPPEPAPASTTPIRATPIIAKPIMVNEDPDATPIEDITPDRDSDDEEEGDE